MEDPVPAGFLTLPEALQRIADCMSEANVESAKLVFKTNARALAEIRRAGEQRRAATSDSSKSEGADSELYSKPSPDAVLEWDKRNFAATVLWSALQTGAVSAMVRSPESGGLFRVMPADWHLEPFGEQIIRGGVIPIHATKGLESHRGRTVLLDTAHFEEWLARAVKSWTDVSTYELCRQWLVQEMIASPNNKERSKDAWFEQAKKKYRSSRREFDRAWSQAVSETGSNWGRPGAPNKSLR